MWQVNTSGIAEFRIVVQREGLADGQFFLAIGEFADAQLRSLQIGQDADRTTDRGLYRTDASNKRAHQVMIGMAHVDAEHIRTCFEELFQHRLIGGSRTDGG